MSAPILQLTLWQAPKFLVNSRLGLFSATAHGFLELVHIPPRLPFSRSYGYNLPSSLTRVLPRTLGFSPRIPVSVYGTGGNVLTRSFSRQRGVSNFNNCLSPHHTSGSEARICLRSTLHACTRTTILAIACPSVSLHCSNKHHRYWNINQLSISYALCLGLGPDLP